MQVLVPATGPDAWRVLLGDPEKHWRTGYSAKTLAYCWHAGAHFPPEFAAVLGGASALRDMEPLIAIPEHKVKIPGKGYPTQMDVWVLARSAAGLVGIGVEGKVAEPFGDTIADWNPEGAGGKLDRLRGLSGLLEVDEFPSDVRYQLVHRTAGTIAETKRFGASIAVMAVHAFDAPDESFRDFETFGRALGVEVERNKAVNAGMRSGVQLWLAWVDGDRRFREA